MYGGDVTKCTTHGQNGVFKHNTRKTLRNNKSRICWTTNFEKCVNNLELVNGLLDQRLIDFDVREDELSREVRRPNNEEQTLRVNDPGLGHTWSPYKCRTSEGLQLVRELHMEVKQLQASAVPPDLTQDFVIQDWKFGMNREEATIESQKADVKSLQRDEKRRRTPCTIGMQATSVRFRVSRLMIVLAHRYH